MDTLKNTKFATAIYMSSQKEKLTKNKILELCHETAPDIFIQVKQNFDEIGKYGDYGEQIMIDTFIKVTTLLFKELTNVKNIKAFISHMEDESTIVILNQESKFLSSHKKGEIMDMCFRDRPIQVLDWKFRDEILHLKTDLY